MTNPPLEQWLQKACPFPQDNLVEIPGDASFRRYFRLTCGHQSYMVMDASRQLDCCQPFFAIAKALSPLGVSVPEILAHDLKQGYMLISDFGDRLYLKELQPNNADQLYKTALTTLARIQACRDVKGWTLPAFDQPFMQKELAEFKHWFLEGYLKLTPSATEANLLQATFDRLSLTASEQQQVFIHRDYHSANLMVLPQNPGTTGILDFQDACLGPVTYDLVSLLRDCYIDWPEEQVYRWVSFYYEMLRENQQLQAVDYALFCRWFDWMGMQRHMKALFIFARKYLRDNTTRYLQYLPRTLNYVLKVSGRYPELQDFHHYAQDQLLATRESLPCAL